MGIEDHELGVNTAMISQVAEKKMHIVRWILVLGWLVLITSLFWDPISHIWSDPYTHLSPFRDTFLLDAKNPEKCVTIQGGGCLPQDPYPMGPRFFWGMIVPAGIMIVFVLGHEFWRRICPLYFLSQIPRRLGLGPVKDINDNLWLKQNHFYLQFSFFFTGLSFRILFINSDRLVLGLFLLSVILAAMLTVYLYGGRTWCHYVCPFGMVQTVFTGPRGLLDSQAQKAPPKTITQSMCRTVDPATGQEMSACIACKSPCMDIDSEKSYWESLYSPGRRLVQYGYFGLVTGYFMYYYFYSGNFWYYFSGIWTHEVGQVSKIWNPGFYFFYHAIPIPKLVAVPLTLALFVFFSCLIWTKIEKSYKAHLLRKNGEYTQEEVLHKIFTVITFLSFNAFFVYGGRPELLRLPFLVQVIFNSIVVFVSTLWLYKTWNRNLNQYTKESMAAKLRRQLQKLSLDFSQVLEGRSLNDLTENELFILAKSVPNITEQNRRQAYKGVIKEAIESGTLTAYNSFEILQKMRKNLGISQDEHYAILSDLGVEEEQLIYPTSAQQNTITRRGNYRHEKTILRDSKRKPCASDETTIMRPSRNENKPDREEKTILRQSHKKEKRHSSDEPTILSPRRKKDSDN